MTYLNKHKNIFSFVFLLIFIFVPVFVFGQEPDTGLIPCDGLDCQFTDFIQLIYNVMRFLIGLGLTFSVIVFAYAGFIYMTAGGDESKIKKAHGMFLSVVIGLVLALGAFLIVEVIANTLGLDSQVWDIINRVSN